MMPAPFIASAETYPRSIKSISTGETPVLMTCAPMPQTMPPPRVLAATTASTTRRMSAAPRIAGSESNHDLNEAPAENGLAKSSARALLTREASGYVRTPDRSNSSYSNGIGRSEYQHRIAVAVKPVALLNGLGIRVQHTFATGKRGHEHQQRRPRQMKVRDHAGHELEGVTGMDEEARLAGPGHHVAIGD